MAVEVQYTGRKGKKKETPTPTYLVNRLHREMRPEFDALYEILQYVGRLREPKDVTRTRWQRRFNVLDARCRKFHIRGILNYQGKKWTEIFDLEKNNNWLVSENTLDRQLELLIAQGLARREPPDGGPGVPGRYYFTIPQDMLGNSDGHRSVPMPDLIVTIRNYVESGMTDEEKAQRIADVLERLVLNFASGLSLVLRRLASKKSIHERALFDTMNNESYELDLHMDFVAMRIIIKEFPELAERSLSIFEERLSNSPLLRVKL